MLTGKKLEEIDAIVDSVVDDESTARALKEALHGVEAAEDATQTDDQDDEEMWDDVPV